MSIISDYYKFYRGGEPSIDFEDTIRAAISLLITKIQERDAKDDVAVTKPWFSVENQYHIGVLQTAIHELRHLQMDTNPFLPEDTYPIEESSEDAVEAYCRDVFEGNLILENIFPNLFEKD